MMSETTMVLNTPATPALRHSGFGIAAFAIALIVGAAELLTVGWASVLVAAATSGSAATAQQNTIVGLLVCGEIATVLLGIGLAVVGLVTKNRRRPFAVMGLVFNVLILLGTAALMAIGIMAG